MRTLPATFFYRIVRAGGTVEKLGGNFVPNREAIVAEAAGADAPQQGALVHFGDADRLPSTSLMSEVMPTKKSKPPSTRAGTSSTSLESFLATLEHPLKTEIHAIREIIGTVDPTIHEDIKWNAPSFHTSEHFATFNLRHQDGVQLVLHLGAKPRPDASVRAAIADPEGLLHWRSGDRATVTFGDLAEVRAKEKAFRQLLQQWIKFV